MPKVMGPPQDHVRVEWLGDVFSRRVQSSIRRALRIVGDREVERVRTAGREEINQDTQAMINSFQAKVPRRSAGSRTYRLELGIFPGQSAEQIRPGFTGNTGIDERAEDYAFWQEVMYHPFIRDAGDRAESDFPDELKILFTNRSGELAFDPYDTETSGETINGLGTGMGFGLGGRASAGTDDGEGDVT